MPPIVATCLTIGLIVFLFRRDIRQSPDSSSALWLPLIWLFIICSRQTTEWLQLVGLSFGGVSLEEGSPLDRLVYAVLIFSAAAVLAKRNVRFGTVIRNNQWLAVFLLYCLLAVTWSDFPFVSLKRWVKVIGHPLMALIILTDLRPKQALAIVMKRCAYVIILVSVLFIKYYPEYGRGFDEWSGLGLNTGITTNKNLLGADCLVLGFFFIWYLLSVWRWPRGPQRRTELFVSGGLFAGLCWLAWESNSKTSLVSLSVGVGLMLFAGWKKINRRHLTAYLVLGVICILVAESTTGIYGTVLHLLGRNATLTDRTLLWQELFKVDINPMIGAGFESFWLGDRMERIWAIFAFHPNQAHNGYIETYLCLGIIGVILLFALLAATYVKAKKELWRDLELGQFRLGFLAAAIVYNWTEAGFKTTHLVFFAFYLITLDFPTRLVAQKRSVRARIPLERRLASA